MIVPEKTLESKRAQIDEAVARRTSDYAVDAQHSVYGEAFRNFVFFHDCGELSAQVGLPEGERSRFLNQYFWFHRFRLLYSGVHGEDAGMEQQEFQMLETRDAEVEWSIINEVTLLAEQGV